MRQTAQSPVRAAHEVGDGTAALVQALQAFYRQHARDLPWRRTRDPYAIWLSETMLQQTRVETVEPRWRAFLATFPTVRALARAHEHEVCEAWAGLGYYRRARSLHAAARQICAAHGGELPRTAALLRTLAGVGPYTAGAVASIAFGEVAPIVDGNVARVLSRLYALSAPLQDPAGTRRLWEIAAQLVQVAAHTGTPGDFNQALMELGAVVCTPRKPRCGACPVSAACVARAEGSAEALPVAAKKTQVRPLSVAFAYCVEAGGLQLRRRPLEGLWAGLWEMPSEHGPEGPRALRARGFVLGPKLAQVGHLLTHRRVTACVYAATLPRGAAERDGLVKHAQPLQAPLSTLARKAIVAAQATVVSTPP